MDDFDFGKYFFALELGEIYEVETFHEDGRDITIHGAHVTVALLDEDHNRLVTKEFRIEQAIEVFISMNFDVSKIFSFGDKAKEQHGFTFKTQK